MNERLNVLFARRSVRQYSTDPITTAQVRDLLEAAMAAPSACGKDPWRFVVVSRRTSLAALADALPNGKMLRQAPLAILVCGDLASAHDNQLSYLLQDCAAAIENLLIAASLLGLGACWLGVHPREERVAALRSLFKLPDNILPVSAVALGHPAENPKPRTRYCEDLVHTEVW